MARYGPADVNVTYNGQDVPDVTVVGGISKEMILEEITPVGSAWETHAKVGVGRFAAITLEAPFSDDANNLSDAGDDVGVGGTASLILLFGGTKQLTISTILQSIQRNIARGALTKTVLTLQPTGVPTEA